MRPLLLKLRGINSYETEQTIDFEHLTSAGLFGIFGTTGSGKSTIIDACTMALFSEMPRQGAREYINSCLNEMYVSLEFELKGKIYTAERLYTRDKDSIKQKRARLYEKDGLVICDKPSEMNNAISSMLGLNYKDFSRSVILPQNKFQDFLMLGDRERSDMLERIFGLEEYGERLLSNLKNAKKNYESELAIVVNGMTYYGDITQQKLKDDEATIVTEQQILENLKADREKLGIELERGKKLLAYAIELEEYKNRLNILNESRDEMEKKRRQLKVAGISRIIMPFIKSSENSAAQIVQLERVLDKQSREHSRVEEILTKAQIMVDETTNGRDKALPELVGLEARIKQAMEIAVDRDVLSLERDTLLATYKLASKNKSTLEAKKNQELASREKARTELNILATKKAELTVSPARRNEIIEAYGLFQEAEKLVLRQKSLKNRINELTGDINTRTNQQDKLKVSLDILINNRLELSEGLKNLDLNRPYIHELRKGLNAGQPCPVCGSTEHVLMTHTKADEEQTISATEWEQKKNHMEKILKNVEEEAEKIKTQIAGLRGHMDRTAALKAELGVEYGNLDQERNRLEALLNKLCEGRSAVKMFEEQAAKDEEISKMQEAESRYRDLDNTLTTEIEKINAEISKFDIEIQGIMRSGNEKREQLNKMAERIKDLIGDRKPTEYLDEVRKEMSGLNKAAEEAKSMYLSAADNAKRLKLEYESSLARHGALLKIHTDENAKIVDLLVMYNMPDRETVKEGWVEDPEGLENEINSYDNQIRDLNANLNRIRLNIPSELIIAEKLAQEVKGHEDEFADMSLKIEQKSEALAVLRERLSTMREDIKKLEELQKRKQKIDRGLDMLSDLGTLLRGKDFIKYISRRHMLGVTVDASNRLREMSKGRYALELDETTFIIRDDYNGGSRRSPHTLSGGETFMVSLCLALALSSGIQLKNNAPLEFFFLDEGFGSLDTHTLDTVMNCLEKLRSEKMSVGIISHVDELKNRVPIRLNVYYSPVSGSTISHED